MPWNDITDEGDYVFPSRERELLKRLDELSEFEADEREQVLKALEAVNTAPHYGDHDRRRAPKREADRRARG